MIRRFSVLLMLLLSSGVIRADSDSLKARIDSIFVIASSGSITYREMVEPAIDSIAAMGEAAIPYLIDKLDTEDARERVTLENIFKKIGAPAVPYLNEALLTTDSLQLSRVALILYYLPDTSSVANLLTVTNNPYYWVRYQAIRALGKIGREDAVPAVKEALLDSNELVRTIAAVSAGRIGPDRFVKNLFTALDDPYYGVRMIAQENLAKLDCGMKAALFAKDSLAHRSLRALRHVLEIMATDSCHYDMELYHWLDYGADPVIFALSVVVQYKGSPDEFRDILSDYDRSEFPLLYYYARHVGIIRDETAPTGKP
jgi:hypothetical protein